jgi:uncharacterized membrane protein YfcA
VLGYPISNIALLAGGIVGAGILVGIFAGLFGIGGGAIIVPVLYEVFRALGVPENVRMQLCIGTSLAIIVPTTIRSYFGHKKRGAVLMGVLSWWWQPAVGGVVLGSVAASYAPAAVFKIAFLLFALFVAARMLWGTHRFSLGKELPGRGTQSVYGFITGLFSSLVGVSGGSVSNAFLTFYGVTLQQAVATSSGLGVPITIAGTIGYMIAGWPHREALPPFSIGFVSLIGLALMAPLSSFTANWGVRLAHWLPRRGLEIGFGLFLLLAAARFLVSLF